MNWKEYKALFIAEFKRAFFRQFVPLMMLIALAIVLVLIDSLRR